MPVTAQALDTALDVFTSRTLAACWQNPARVAAAIEHSATNPGRFTITGAPYVVGNGLRVTVASPNLPSNMTGVSSWFIRLVTGAGSGPGIVNLYPTYEAYLASTGFVVPANGGWTGTAYDNNLVEQVDLTAVLTYEANHTGYARQTGVSFASAAVISPAATSLTREVAYTIQNTSSNPVNVNHMVMFSGTNLEAVTLMTGSSTIAVGTSMSTFSSLTATRV